LEPVALFAEIICPVGDVSWDWRNLTSGQVFGHNSNPVTLDALLTKTTWFEFTVSDNLTGTGETARTEVVVLVPAVPGYTDPNGDGCNSVEDLLILLENWLQIFQNNDDPNADGRFDMRDLLYINIGPTNCGP
jgi:hypothetical protein